MVSMLVRRQFWHRAQGAAVHGRARLDLGHRRAPARRPASRLVGTSSQLPNVLTTPRAGRATARHAAEWYSYLARFWGPSRGTSLSEDVTASASKGGTALPTRRYCAERGAEKTTSWGRPVGRPLQPPWCAGLRGLAPPGRAPARRWAWYLGTTPAFGKRDSRRAAALSPVASNDCVEGQLSRKLGAPHGFGCQQTRMGVRGRRPMGSLGRRHRGWWDVRPTRRAAVVRSRSVARKSRTLLALLAATWDRPPAGALDWDGRSDCP